MTQKCLSGSGKTGAFALPVLQLVQEAYRREREGKGGGGGGGAPAWRMSDMDKDAMLGIAGDGVTCENLTPRWVGGRASAGVTAGKVGFGLLSIVHDALRVTW
jgi:ATP-dependent RNA helicase DDX1